MRIPLLLFIGLTALLLPTYLQAQGTELRFNYLTIEDGLSQSTVQSILQDNDGYMWFGTQDGLNKYNGYDIIIYKFEPNNPNSLTLNDIRVIYEDSRGNIWIGGQSRGLNLYNKEKDHFTHFLSIEDDPETISDNTVWDIFEDSKGTFWIGTGYGLSIMDRESGTFQRIYSDVNDSSTINHNEIRAILEDSKGRIWIGTANGVSQYNYDKEGFRQFLYNQGDGIEGNIVIRTIIEDRQGTLWFGSEDHGLFYLKANSTEFEQFKHDPLDNLSLGDNGVFTLLEDSRGNIWVGTGNQGLNLFDKSTEKFHRYKWDPQNINGLNNNSINSLYESKDGILWVGTFAGGVNYLDPTTSRFLHYRNNPMYPTSLSNNSVLSFNSDKYGNIWVGTDGGGLNLFDPETGTFQHFRQSNDDSGPSSDVILDITQSKDGGLWLGTYGGGIDYFNPAAKTFQNYRHTSGNKKSLSSDYVFTILENSSGYLWAGTNWGGINVKAPQKHDFTHYMMNLLNPTDSTTISNNEVRKVYEDKNGDIWIGNYSGQLTHFNPEDSLFYRYSINQDENYHSHIINYFAEDKKGRFWLASKGGGLKLFDRDTKKVTSYTTEAGLASNIIHAIIVDDNGYLWLSTNNGISRFNPENESFINYKSYHGIQGREFNPCAAYRDENGYIYFGGVNGFNVFHPDSIKIDSVVPPVVYTELMIFNKHIPIGEDSPLDKHISQKKELVLPHTASVITLGYSALNFSSIKGNNFAYKLEGFDDDWNYVGKQRQATYTNLNPGTYYFKVMASNRDGFWDENGRTLTLIITPPFWKTGWFIGLVVIVLAGIIYLIYRMRIRSIEKQNQMLAKLVSERTSELKAANATKEKLFSVIAHDLKNSISGIVGLAELLKDSADQDKSEEVKTFASHLYQASANFTNLLNNLLAWARSQSGRIEYTPTKFDLYQLSKEVISHEETRAVSKGIELQHQIEPGFEVYADKNLTSVVLRNLVQNALKFTEKDGKIIVGATSGAKYAEIFVSDTGIGMDEETQRKIFSEGKQITTHGTSNEKGTGLGLALCIEFIRRNGGVVRSESEPGKGTTIYFTLPVSQSYVDEEELSD